MAYSEDYRKEEESIINKKRILLVEDDAIITSGLVYALEQEGYAVVHGKDVGGAKQALSNDTFDLAILDMQMPDGSGFDVREMLTHTDTAAIFLTAVDDEGNIVRAFEGGFVQLCNLLCNFIKEKSPNR